MTSAKTFHTGCTGLLTNLDWAMEQVNVYEAKTQLSRLLERVEAGEVIVIAHAGRPIARLVPYTHSAERHPGAWRGQVRIAEDFDDLPEGLLGAFGGEEA